jgi:biopolymer transport protein ExbB
MLQHALLSFALGGADWVLWLLVLLSLLCVAVTVERAIGALLNHTPQGALRAALADFGRTGSLGTLRSRLHGLRGAQARVLAAGTARVEAGIASVEEALMAATALERVRMDRFLSVLGTAGSTSPFIGLFGTVLGIIQAFHDLAQNQAEAASAVMAGISEALVATAIGLMVAIPAVVLYNVFQRLNKDVLTNTDALAHVLLSELKATGHLAGKG